MLTKAAREAVPVEIHNFRQKLFPLYSYAEQLVFIDETFKDGRQAYRRYGWSKRNTKAVVTLPFKRGKRISVMVALDVNGFFRWDWTEGTFTRGRFHHAFLSRVVSKLNPWPLPRSIVIMDNAKIHAYPSWRLRSISVVLVFVLASILSATQPDRKMFCSIESLDSKARSLGVSSLP